MIRKSIIFFLFLIPSLCISAHETIVRTNETGFYQITPKDAKKFGFNNSLKNKSITLSNINGSTSYFYPKKKSNIEKGAIVFFANKLTGKFTNQHSLDDFNGFKLTDGVLSNVDQWVNIKPNLNRLPKCKNITTFRHYEENNVLIRINSQEYKQAPETWYWKKMSQLNVKGFEFPIDVSQINTNNDIQIQTRFRGINVDKAATNIPDHVVTIQFNEHDIATLKWDGKLQYDSDTINIPASLIKENDNKIKFIVPKRKIGNTEVIDLSFLDYFNIYYSIIPKYIGAKNQLSSPQDCKFKLKKNQFSYSEDSQIYTYKSVKLSSNAKIRIGDLKKIKKPIFEPITPFNQDFSQVEYLMISHPLFMNSIQPLIHYYKSQGVNVALIDINQIYQKYSYGVRELSSIKKLIKEAFIQGNGKLQHVLLVGDSSWDWRDEDSKKFYSKWAHNNFPHYTIPQKKYETQIANRDFIPTGQYHSSQGHSASDNWFVSIIQEKDQRPYKGILPDDFMPDLAIGRFPASTVDEANSMVSKTLNYINNTKVGPWKNKILWITNTDQSFQYGSKKVSKFVGKHGVMANNIFPKEMDGDNVKIQKTLSRKMNDGNLIVHFIGHGGSSIWRIGPTDVKYNRDLFTLDHVSALKNKDTLPFVLSMSCFSAPFDHPVADSIGEKFIRQPNAGAVAVLAASWRMTPRTTFSNHVINNIYEYPKLSLGQAILKAKRKYRGKIMLEMFNLFGDPALQLAIPSLKMSAVQSNSNIKVKIPSPKFNGNALIEFLDKSSNVISNREIKIASTEFNIALSKLERNCLNVRIYAWDSEQNLDAMTNLTCEKQNQY